MAEERAILVEPPAEFVCSLTMDLMEDPVVSRYGQSYERMAICEWLALGHDTCPMTRQPLRLSGLITNYALRTRIERWKRDNLNSPDALSNSKEKKKKTKPDKGDHVYGNSTCPSVDSTESESSSTDDIRQRHTPCLGFLTLPEDAADPTEHPHDDEESIVEVRRRQQELIELSFARAERINRSRRRATLPARSTTTSPALSSPATAARRKGLRRWLTSQRRPWVPEESSPLA